MPRPAAAAQSSSTPEPSPERGLTSSQPVSGVPGSWASAAVKMGRSAHDAHRGAADHCAHMDGRGVLHLIEDDLSETWVEDWAGVGVAAIEDYLEKHPAFLDFLEDAAASS